MNDMSDFKKCFLSLSYTDIFSSADREYVLDFIKDSELIITAWGSPKLDDEMILLCPDLCGIIHAGGGIKGLLSDEFIKRNLFISSANGALADGVAESTVAMAVSACKGMFSLPSDIRSGLWDVNNILIKHKHTEELEEQLNTEN